PISVMRKRLRIGGRPARSLLPLAGEGVVRVSERRMRDVDPKRNPPSSASTTSRHLLPLAGEGRARVSALVAGTWRMSGDLCGTSRSVQRVFLLPPDELARLDQLRVGDAPRVQRPVELVGP